MTTGVPATITVWTTGALVAGGAAGGGVGAGAQPAAIATTSTSNANTTYFLIFSSCEFLEPMICTIQGKFALDTTSLFVETWFGRGTTNGI